MLLDAFVVESAADLDPAKCHVLLDIVAGPAGPRLPGADRSAQAGQR